MSHIDHVLDHLGDVILLLEVDDKDQSQAASDAGDADDTQRDSATRSDQETDHETPTKRECYRYRISSRHLCLASPTFQAMLEGPWKETPGTHDSPTEVKVGSWDHEAMLTLLRILHGRHNDVLRRPTLKQLCNIAILVDYYKCSEAIVPYSDLWLHDLDNSCPETLTDESLTYLFIARTFRRRPIFERVVTALMMDAQGPLATHLPIAPHLIDKLDSRRAAILNGLFGDLDTLKNKLYDDAVCQNEAHKGVCNSLMLGSLLKKLRDMGMGDLRPAPLHVGYSVRDLNLILSVFKNSEYVRIMSSGYSEYSRSSHSYHNNMISACDISSELKPILDWLLMRAKEVCDFDGEWEGH